MTIDEIYADPRPDEFAALVKSLRSAVKSGALSNEDAIGHLRTVCGLSQAGAADLIREPQ